MTTSIIFLIIGFLFMTAAFLIFIFGQDGEKIKLLVVFIFMCCASILFINATLKKPYNSKDYYVNKTVITKTIDGKEVKRDTLMRFEPKNK